MMTTINHIPHAKGTVWVWGKCERCGDERAVRVEPKSRLCDSCRISKIEFRNGSTITVIPESVEEIRSLHNVFTGELPERIP